MSAVSLSSRIRNAAHSPALYEKKPAAFYRPTRKKPTACAPHRVKKSRLHPSLHVAQFHRRKKPAACALHRVKKISSSPFFARCSIPHTKKARRLLSSHTKKACRYFAAGSLQYISESPPWRADIRKSLLSGVEFDNQVRFHHRGIRYIVKLRYKSVLCRQFRRINFQIRREVACLRLDSRHNDSQLL